MITLLVMTDGRKDCIERSIPAALANLHGPTPTRIIHDDSGDPAYEDYLWATFEPFGFTVYSTGKRQGFAGAIRSAWAWLREHDRNPYIFHLEDDFIVAPVKLGDMVHALVEHPNIVQMALRRQPIGAEIAAGGFLHDSECVAVGKPPTQFLAHRKFYTTNPSLYRRELIVGNDWPEGSESEGRFSANLFTDPETYCGYWSDTELCEHIGRTRVGHGY